MSSPAWTDLGATTARQVSNPVLECPFNGVSTPYVLTQDFQQPYANFSALALNTAHPDDATYKLTREFDFKDLGGGQQRWTREYCKTPSQRIELSTTNYNFIGYFGPRPPTSGSVDPSTAYGRDRRVHFVKVKHQFDYYLVDGSIIASQYDIPVVAETKYLVGGTSSIIEVEALWDTTTGGFTFVNASDPSLTTYEGYIAADAATASSFSIVYQGSSVRRWKGNIWERETLYVKAI